MNDHFSRTWAYSHRYGIDSTADSMTGAVCTMIAAGVPNGGGAASPPVRGGGGGDGEQRERHALRRLLAPAGGQCSPPSHFPAQSASSRPQQPVFRIPQPLRWPRRVRSTFPTLIPLLSCFLPACLCSFQADDQLAAFIADELYRFEPFLRNALKAFIEVGGTS